MATIDDLIHGIHDGVDRITQHDKEDIREQLVTIDNTIWDIVKEIEDNDKDDSSTGHDS